MAQTTIDESILVKENTTAPALPTTDAEESVLWAKFRGYSWSERSRDLSSWVWPFGFDIQNDKERRWVCKTCVLKRRIPIASYKAEGTQNIERHLDEIHKICDPTGKRKRPLKKAYPSVADRLCMDREDPQQQAIVNAYVKRFDRTQFQKLVVNWVVERQQSFREVESESLRAIFEYLNPSISVELEAWNTRAPGYHLNCTLSRAADSALRSRPPRCLSGAGMQGTSMACKRHIRRPLIAGFRLAGSWHSKKRRPRGDHADEYRPDRKWITDEEA
ncbi:hypothetical protein AUP68_11205 [Ilyonectria robusta]